MKNQDSIRCLPFDFGKNWSDFSEKVLTHDHILQAKSDFHSLMNGIRLKEKSFLDIGFGQGLSLLIASEMGAKAYGCDIDPKCRDVLKRNHRFFPEVGDSDIPAITGSILEKSTIQRLRRIAPTGDGYYDIVHSWGALHHTGDMMQAIRNATSLVRDKGFFVVALYNRHWTSPVWHGIKRIYCRASTQTQKGIILLFYPVIFLAKLMVTRKNPLEQSRGMDFYFNVIDWIGGYPYEYTSLKEVENYSAQLGFKSLKIVPAKVPTGCNEFIFQKVQPSQ